ncbi:MAG: neutral/alkaline non-lysosomal ceramidase N-terminal domain-containing protein, partial [Planctomycetota bacterium]
MMGQNLLRVTLLFVVILFVGIVFCSPGHAALKGGCGKVNITPPIGVWLSGYGGRDKPSDDIEDELYAKALVLDDGSESIAIITLDLLWVPLEITGKVRAIVREKVGIPEQNILICATHTHFGPKIFSGTKMGPDVSDNTVDASYVETLVKKMTDSVFLAHKNMQEVKVGAAKGEVPEVVYNRRPRRKDG